MSLFFLQADIAEASAREANVHLSVVQELYTRATGHVLIGDGMLDMDVSQWSEENRIELVSIANVEYELRTNQKRVFSAEEAYEDLKRHLSIGVLAYQKTSAWHVRMESKYAELCDMDRADNENEELNVILISDNDDDTNAGMDPESDPYALNAYDYSDDFLVSG